MTIELSIQLAILLGNALALVSFSLLKGDIKHVKELVTQRLDLVEENVTQVQERTERHALDIVILNEKTKNI